MKVIRKHKINCITFFVLAALFLALTFGIHYATGLYLEDFATIASVWAIFGVLILTLVGLAVREIFAIRTIKQNLINPTTLSYATYGEGNDGKYLHFITVLDKAAQGAMNVATNVVGVASFLIGGVGVFGFSMQYSDVFVATDEIVINNPAKNPKLRDDKFRRIPASEIERAAYERKGNKVIVNLFLPSGQTINMTANLQNEAQINALCETLKSLKTREYERTGGRDPFAGFAPSL